MKGREREVTVSLGYVFGTGFSNQLKNVENMKGYAALCYCVVALQALQLSPMAVKEKLQIFQKPWSYVNTRIILYASSWNISIMVLWCNVKYWQMKMPFEHKQEDLDADI